MLTQLMSAHGTFLYLVYSNTEDFIKFLRKAGVKTGWTHYTTFVCGVKAPVSNKKPGKGKGKKEKKNERKDRKGKAEAKEGSSSESFPTIIRDAVTFVSVYGSGDVCVCPCSSFHISYQQYAKHRTFLLPKTPPSSSNLILYPFRLFLHPSMLKQRVSFLSIYFIVLQTFSCWFI